MLVRCLGTKEATGKTFEVQSLPGFEKVSGGYIPRKENVQRRLNANYISRRVQLP